MTWTCAPVDPWFGRANPVPDPNEIAVSGKAGSLAIAMPSAQPGTGYRAGFFAAAMSGPLSQLTCRERRYFRAVPVWYRHPRCPRL